jgi:hypothetical protein
MVSLGRLSMQAGLRLVSKVAGLWLALDFENAFDHARVLIHRWEMTDGVVPSNPQARFGRGLVGKLARFFATNPGH